MVIAIIYLICYGISKLFSKHKVNIGNMGYIWRIATACFVISICSWIINKFIINNLFFASVCRYGLVAALILFATQICVWIFTAR